MARKELRSYPSRKVDSQSGTSVNDSTDSLDTPRTKDLLNGKGPGQIDERLTDLARKISTASHQPNHSFMFDVRDDSPLNPLSSSFNARKWAHEFYNVKYSGNDGSGPRAAGVAFTNLNVFGYGSPVDYQMSVGNALLKVPTMLRQALGGKKQRINILRDIEGLVLPGELLCVLGPPGSGCSTFLRTIAGETHGLNIDSAAYINYHGISPQDMLTAFRGEATYTAEVDAHFPMLSVGDTLYFAALARAPRTIPGGMSRSEYARHLRDVIMAMFGIGHTLNTRVGNDFVRGVSGGERKRVTIAEAALGYAPLQCWDNSTRGLDSANAVEFCRTLRTQSDVFGITSCVAIYQAPQAAYNIFDKVIVLYEGRQIYFGPAAEAKKYFESLGFHCPAFQTTADFLTSMSSPSERIVKEGYERHAPRTPEDFAQRWKESRERQALLDQIEAYRNEHPLNGKDLEEFSLSRQREKSKHQRHKSPYTLSYWGQIKLCMWREWQRLRNDPSVELAMLIGNFFEALIIASIFYNLPVNTSSFFYRGALLFMLVLLNAFAGVLEIFTLYEKRTIVEKQSRYAYYHPSAEAISSLIMSFPYKITNALLVNLTLYFMSNLRREPGPFFFFLLISFSMMMGMSMFFRWFASLTKSIDQALAPSSIILLALVLYTGFAIPVSYMRGWAAWIRWINPVAYGFEAVMVNEFHGREFPCMKFVPSGPGYEGVSSTARVCSVVGSVPGSDVVQGTAFVQSSYGYENSHRWRDFGIIVAMIIFLAVCHLITTELVASKRSKGEVLVFRRGSAHVSRLKQTQSDEERPVPSTIWSEKGIDEINPVSGVEKQTSIFHWEDVCYDIKIKDEPRRLLDHVDGWIKPGTLTALMGVSGAGKTTLLDVLASRTTMGVITGDMLVDGRQRDGSFQRKTGYVQQQDLHLATSTVREALEFSALLRQPSQFSHAEKLAYVETVIDLLHMREYADAIVGVPGEGLNVEQRKRLTIGVELAARPKLLLFLDEPTSGLDSQTAWSICNLMETLTKNGQAILCTIHQPSAMLFQRFDRLLLLAKGGKTVYFGEIGPESRTLMDYFARNGGPSCPPGSNPAEHMLEVIGAAPGAHTDIDWPAVWRNSPEYQQVHRELSQLRQLADTSSRMDSADSSNYGEFAASFPAQVYEVGLRVFQQYWRTPSYIYSKALLTIGSSLFIGFSFFKADNTAQGLQNQMFGVFVFLFVIIQLILQIIPTFVTQRTLYESRERQSKTYSWQAFVLSNIFVEIAWNSLSAVFCFLVWFYPVGVYRNAEYTDTVHSRSMLVFLIIWAAFLFASSFAHLLIAGVSSAEIASALSNIMSIMMYAFCGILAGPHALPGFWIFMYRVNPLTYLVSGLLSASVGDAPMHCAENELLAFVPPANQTCGEYMESYMGSRGGYLLSSVARDECRYCQVDNTNQFLANFSIDFSTRWRDFGLLWVYIAVNTAGAMFLYWLCRVPKRRKGQ
ncbi:putative ABC multidrug transporter [Aspergillus clavatus NRRL 1]|uniref:ABC multidrug transporter, putative n=1 Tax=Aspergillus clavatus (strain ATCC 1007 / CBS 513.65 / DSM 816 / NCTC 3887 / NRRL 1 / QM 1276 / 107) TaxID=344612 RepID=A1C5R3_ASPCL|nr:ABC multidrug transporter, putative [Aspergillus clavatus NRRL 1]EAW15031.1 ABC multidrug transporter, putative [Aspergillus clavatus NRRL 1]